MSTISPDSLKRRAAAVESKWLPIIKETDHIFTWTSANELAYLAELASQHFTIIEIGSYMGRSAKVMARATAGTVYCIDDFAMAGLLKVFQYFLRDEIATGKVVPIVADAGEGLHCVQSLLHGRLADMIFIDDGHTFEDVTRDITLALTVLSKGGVLVGHDYYDEPGNDVSRAVKHCLGNFEQPCGCLWEWRRSNVLPGEQKHDCQHGTHR